MVPSFGSQVCLHLSRLVVLFGAFEVVAVILSQPPPTMSIHPHLSTHLLKIRSDVFELEYKPKEIEFLRSKVSGQVMQTKPRSQPNRRAFQPCLPKRM